MIKRTDVPRGMTRRMVALLRAFGDPSITHPSEVSEKLEPVQLSAFTHPPIGFAGFVLDLPGQAGLNISTDNIVAHPGGGQALATILDAVYNRVTTVATSGDSVKLVPAVLPGLEQVVVNAAANSLNVYTYPGSGGPGDSIEGPGGPDVLLIGVPPGKAASFRTTVVGKYAVFMSA